MDKEKYIAPEMDFLEIAAERGFAESFGTEPIEQDETEVPW